jgi:epoxyqueuosine reductase
LNSLEKTIIEISLREGFSLVGFARLRKLHEKESFFHEWLSAGRHGEMDWLAREPGRRFDPRILDPGLQSVISLAWRYHAPRAENHDWRTLLTGRMAAYAAGPDYHDVVLAKARAVAAEIQALRPRSKTRIYVDTGPVFEREWAAESRLGWFGRNTNLINRYEGSYFFLAEIFTDLLFDAPSEPYREHCGTCTRCLDLCPTRALSDGYLLEPRLCISYLTIEHRGPIPRELRPRMGNWIFGCDICQEVCPWNSDASRAAPYNPDLTPSLAELMSLTEDEFRNRYRKSAVKRTKRRGLLRNAAIALGNSGNPEAVPILTRVLAEEREEVVRSHAAWALGQTGGAAARNTLESAYRADWDPSVREEARYALDVLLA